MNIEFLSTVALITPDPPASRTLYLDTLGLPLAGMSTSTASRSPVASPSVSGRCRRPLRRASGPRRPAARPVPQISIEFDVADADAVDPASRELQQAGYALLHPPREEPWGQTVARLQSPEGAIIGISYIPSFHDHD